MNLTLYLAVGLATLSALHIASANTAFRSKSKRTILGAGTGGLSYGILEEWTSAISLVDASLQGDLGIYGLVFATGFFALLGVWAWNLFTTRKFLVR